MSTYLLIHGAGHGAWCWHNVIPHLERAGHNVVTLDLPSLGQDCTPPGDVTLEGMVGRVEASLEPIEGQVILVGHSFSGILLNVVGERHPEAIKHLVYLTAYLLPSNMSLSEVQAGDDRLAALGEEKRIVDEEAGTITIREEAIRRYYYNESPDEAVALARILLNPTPMQPASVPIETTADNYGRLKKTFISCRKDKAIPPYFQDAMLEDVPCDEVVELPTDHSPFFSSPRELASVLRSI